MLILLVGGYLLFRYLLWKGANKLSKVVNQKIIFKSKHQEAEQMVSKPLVFETTASISDVISDLKSHIGIVQDVPGFKAAFYMISQKPDSISFAYGSSIQPIFFAAKISFSNNEKITKGIFSITNYRESDGMLMAHDSLKRLRLLVRDVFESTNSDIETKKQTSNKIYCQNCGTDNLTSSAFCIECGSKLSSEHHQTASSSKSKAHNQGGNQKVHQLKNMALMLDKACKDGVVVDEEVEKAQNVLNSINEKYQDDNDILGSDGYLIYEVQGLIHWVKGEEKDAKDLIRSAKNAKGDSQLFTDSANDLRNSLLW